MVQIQYKGNGLSFLIVVQCKLFRKQIRKTSTLHFTDEMQGCDNRIYIFFSSNLFSWLNTFPFSKRGEEEVVD